MFLKQKDKILIMLFPFLSGLVNIAGLLSFSIVTTNVAGHFPGAMKAFVLKDWNHAYQISLFVLAYFWGSFFSSLFFFRYTDEKVKVAIPVFVNLICLIFAFFTRWDTLLKTMLLFFGMASHNAFSNNITKGLVKPPQMTGIVIDVATNWARWWVKDENMSVKIYTQLKVILFFMLGAFTNLWIYYGLSESLFVLPIVVQVLILLIFLF